MKRNKFSLSHTRLLSCDMAELVPIGLTEVLPGDTFQHNTSALLRCSPLLAPVMHPVRVRIHHWFVPHRIIWEDWEDFITGGPDGMNASVFPTIEFPNGGPEVGTLADYLGVPVDIVNASGTDVSALPFRGYAKIWNECYRDQDLQTELTIDETSGADTTTSVALQRVAWEKDYYTSSRPWEQKGPSITIPLGSSAPLQGTAPITGLAIRNDQAAINTATGAMTGPSAAGDFATGTTRWESNSSVQAMRAQTTGIPNGTTNRPQIFADLSGVTANLSGASAITVTALREALALQRFEENRARYGSRYSEYLRSWGVSSSDARLQRPEYLGGGVQTIQFSEVLQTAEGTNPVGELRGHGIAAMKSNRYRKFFEEHGYVFSLMSVLPKTIYMQGLHRHWNRRTKEDYFQPELQHIGQQEVLNKEVYASHATPDGVFGYQDRYDEYRRQESMVLGEFRTSTLNHWHLAREFASDPALNATFVSSVPTERVFAVPSEDVLYVMVKHNLRARRLVAGSGSSFIR